MRCPTCNTENPGSGKFCSECGARLVAPADAPAPEMPGERRHLTVMFCDLVGSTEISSRLDPEEWRELVSDYHRLAAKAIARFGGHLAKYLGDGVMAYFGWPEAHDNDAERAALAGLAIIDATRVLNTEGAAKRPNLSVRIGIDTGIVVVGHGGGSASEVFGDTPNIAARVQSAAEPDTVLVTPAVHRLISGLFVVEARGAHQLKGIAQPVELYRVVRVSGARGRFAASAARGLTPLVGRAEETGLLWKRWERAKEGEGQFVFIAGEAGIGKSRLLHHFRERVAHTPHTWNECAGVSHFQNTPFYPIADMLERAFAQRGETPHEKLTRLEGDLEDVGLPLGEAVPLIAPMAGIKMGGKYEVSKLSPQKQRERLLATLTEWLLGVAREQPLVMAVEDLHWFDASTLELIQLLAEQSATNPVLLICTARPEFRAPWEPLTHHTHVALERLAAEHVRELVNQVVASSALSREAIEHVIERTGGVPLFVEELTRAVVESGDAAPSEHAIPATLHDSLMSRLDRLGGAKEIAQVASVIGREFSYGLLRHVSQAPDDHLHAALAKLAEADLIHTRGQPPDATYGFRHALIQDAAYEALLKSRRRELHRQVAQVMTDRFPALAELQPEVLARHWTSAAEAEPAIAAWRKAGDAAFARYACKETEVSYRHALDLIGTLPESRERDTRELELLNRFVPLLQLTRGWGAPEAAEAVERAHALAEKTDNLPQLLLQAVGSFVGVLSRGDLAGATALASQVFDLAQREGSPSVLGLGRVIKLSACYMRGDLLEAEQHYLAGESLFKTAGERFPSTIGSGFGFGGHVAWLLGHADIARDRIRRAVEDARAIASPFEIAYAQHIAAMLRLFLREYADAKIAAAESIALSEEHGFQQYAAGSRVFLGLAEAALGRPREAMPVVNAGMQGLHESGAEIMMTLYLCWVAIAQSLVGNLSEAIATMERALQVNPAEKAWIPDVLRMRGEIRRRLGQGDEAEHDFREAMDLAKQISAKAWELRAAISLARAIRKRGDIAQARGVLAPLYASFTEGFDTPDLKDAKSLLDELN